MTKGKNLSHLKAPLKPPISNPKHPQTTPAEPQQTNHQCQTKMNPQDTYKFIPVPYRGPMAKAKELNGTYRCSARGCTELRNDLFKHCKKHHVRYKAYGHPHGGPIKAALFRKHRQAVSEVLEVNLSHAGVAAGLAYMTNLFAQAKADEHSFSGADEVQRIIRHGVTPKEALIELCCFHTYVLSNPYALPDQRSEQFGLARALLSLAPMPRVVTAQSKLTGSSGYPLKLAASGLLYIGTTLKTVLAHLLANVAVAVAGRDDQLKVTEASLRAPLAVPTVALMTEMAAKATVHQPPAAADSLPFSPPHSTR